MKDRIEQLGRAAADSLEGVVRELLARKPGGHLLGADPTPLELNLTLPLLASPRDLSAELIDAIDRELDDRVEAAAAFRPGHAWCHRCEVAICEHSPPPTSRHVFAGYGQTGVPRWIDLAQWCLELRHPDVDRLYDARPAFVTLTRNRGELHLGLLAAFRRDRYELLGQLVAGFFPVRVPAEDGRGVVALTFQAAATRGSRGGEQYGFNVLGCAPSGEALSTLWERHEELPWRKPLQWAHGALRTLSSKGRRRLPREQFEQRIDGILEGLGRRLSRELRARGRRTRHAEQRHDSGSRPTRKALDDARAAASTDCLVDERTGTFVVLGPRGRTHFFSERGQLVSSVRYGKEAVARKIQRKHWRPVTDDAWNALRERLD